MIEAIWLLACYLSPGVIGALLLPWLGIRWHDDPWAYPVWAYTFGCLSLGLAIFLWLVVGLPIAWLPSLSLLLVASPVLAGLLGRRPGAESGDPSVPAPWLLRGALILCLLLTGGRMIYANSRAVATLDEAAIWAAKAKAIFLAGGFGAELEPLLEPGPFAAVEHADYPLLNPLLQVWVFSNLGRVVDLENRIPIQLFMLALVLMAAASLRRQVRPGIAAGLLVGLVALPSARFLSLYAYADHMVALGLLIALDAWLRGREARGSKRDDSTADRWWPLIWLGLAFALWSKNEGLMWLAAVLGVATGHSAWQRLRDLHAQPRSNARRMLAWCCLPLFVAATQKFFNLRFDVANDLMGGAGEPPVWALWGSLGWQRLPQVGQAFFDTVADGPSALWLLPMAVAFGWLQRAGLGLRLGLPGLVLLAGFVGYHLVYLGTYHDLAWHLGTSYRRVLFHQLPATALWLAATAALHWPFLRSAGLPWPRLQVDFAFPRFAWQRWVPAIGIAARRISPFLLMGLLVTVAWVSGPGDDGSADRPLAGEANPMMMAESLRFDGDLRFTEEDLDRGRARWQAGPCGLELGSSQQPGAEIHYSGSWLYAGLAVPFTVLAGSRGFLLLHAVLLLGLWWLVRQRRDGPSMALAVAFLLISAWAVRALLPEPGILTSCLLFAAVWWWQSRSSASAASLALTGALLVLAAHGRWPLIFVGLAPLIDLLLARRWRATAALLLGGLCCAWLLTTMDTWLGIPSRLLPLPSAASTASNHQRIFCEDGFPLDDAQPFHRKGRLLVGGAWPASVPPTALLLESWYFFFGGASGLVAFYPFALYALCMFGVGGGGGRRRFLLFAILLPMCLWGVWTRAATPAAQVGILGNPDFALLYPLMFLLLGRAQNKRWLLAAGAAAVLWTLSLWTVPWAYRADSAMSKPAISASRLGWLPLELTRFGPGSRYDGHWRFPPRDSNEVHRSGLLWLGNEAETKATQRGFLLPRRGHATLWAVSPSPITGVELVLEPRGQPGELVLKSTVEEVVVPLTGSEPAGDRTLTVYLAVEPSAVGLRRFFGRRESYSKIHLEHRTEEAQLEAPRIRVRLPSSADFVSTAAGQ